MKYKFIDAIKSDVMFEAYGKTEKELFENAAEALCTVFTNDIKQIKPEQRFTAEIKAKDLKSLMFEWLQQLIAMVDIEQVFLSKFNVIEISNTHLKAEVFGEPLNPDKGGTVVKAVTNYKFDVKKTDDGFIAVVSLDI